MSTGHPSNHGFVQCQWCRVWHRAENTHKAKGSFEDGMVLCNDAVKCNEFRAEWRERNWSRDGQLGFDANGSETP